MSAETPADLAQLRADALASEPVPGMAGLIARASVEASWSKVVGGAAPLASLVVDVAGRRELDASTIVAVTDAVQRAAALVVRGLREPGKDPSQLYRGDTDKAALIQRGQIGPNILFEIKRAQPGEDQLEMSNLATLTERAVNELVETLPGGPTDQTAVDAIFGQRGAMKLAVQGLAGVARDVSGIDMTWTIPGRDPVTSTISAGQAAELVQGLAEETLDVRETYVSGRLDGMRTMRRIFFLFDEDEHEISGAIDPDLVAEVQRGLNKRVSAQLLVTRTRSAAGRLGRPHYLLIGLSIYDQIDG